MTGKAIPVSSGDLEEYIRQNALVLADFYGEGCAPCGMIRPTVDRLAEKYSGRAVVVTVEVNREKALADRYRIQTIPTVLVVRDGLVIAQETGPRLDGIYEEILDANL